MNRNFCSPAAVAGEGRKGQGVHFPVPQSRMPRHFLGNAEPALDELLSDDVMMRLMARDGVVAEQVRDLVGFIPA